MSELISVIVPVYKVEPFLDKCIQSIVEQSYTNLEIILVDDGSPDQCPALCDQWAKKDSRIKVIHQKNAGLSAARNAGIDLAGGDYLAFVDSDDYIAPDMYEKLHTALVQNQADISECNFKMVYPDGTHFYLKFCPLEDCVLTADQALSAVEDNWVHTVQWNKLIKKEIYSQYRLPIGRIHEDEFAIHHLFAAANKIVCIQDALYYYVQRPDSIMSAEWNPRRLDWLYALFDRYAFYKSTNRDPLASRVLYNAFKFNNEQLNHMRGIFDQKPFFKPTIKTAWLLLCAHDRRCFELLMRYLKLLIKPALYPAYKSIRFKKQFGKMPSPKIVLMATPEHGNLGDHAIVLAEKQVLMQLYPQIPQIEVPNSQYSYYKDQLRKHIKQDDLIVIDGGGNLGSLWTNEDDKIADIIDTFKDNRILIFPQTCYYNNYEMNTRLPRNQTIYASAIDLTVMLRDRTSYDFFTKHFPNTRAAFVPDIVLSLERDTKQPARSGVLLCFRTDKERVISEATTQEIQSKLELLDVPYTQTSTVLEQNVSSAQRELAVQEKLEEFAGAQLLITDRLHGMIFAAITHTPCIAVDNVSKKVGGVYEWIKDLPYICYLEDASLIAENIERMLLAEYPITVYQYPTDMFRVFKDE